MKTNTSLVGKLLGAVWAFKGFDVEVHVHVPLIVLFKHELLLADVAFKFPFIQMNLFLVILESTRRCESCVTSIAQVQLSGANFHLVRSRHGW